MKTILLHGACDVKVSSFGVIWEIFCNFAHDISNWSMRTEHLDFITFCVGSLSDALCMSATQVFSAYARRASWTTISCHATTCFTRSARTILWRSWPKFWRKGGHWHDTRSRIDTLHWETRRTALSRQTGLSDGVSIWLLCATRPCAMRSVLRGEARTLSSMSMSWTRKRLSSLPSRCAGILLRFRHI